MDMEEEMGEKKSTPSSSAQEAVEHVRTESSEPGGMGPLTTSASVTGPAIEEHEALRDSQSSTYSQPARTAEESADDKESPPESAGEPAVTMPTIVLPDEEEVAIGDVESSMSKPPAEEHTTLRDSQSSTYSHPARTASMQATDPEIGRVTPLKQEAEEHTTSRDSHSSTYSEPTSTASMQAAEPELEPGTTLMEEAEAPAAVLYPKRNSSYFPTLISPTIHDEAQFEQMVADNTEYETPVQEVAEIHELQGSHYSEPPMRTASARLAEPDMDQVITLETVANETDEQTPTTPSVATPYLLNEEDQLQQLIVDTNKPASVMAHQTNSPDPQTPTATVSPVSPLSSSESRFKFSRGSISRDSMASISLSESDQDWDHLSAEQVEEFLATPRVRAARHTRKPSSLDILQNPWTLNRQSTLFDMSQDEPETPALKKEEERRGSMGFGDLEVASLRTDSTTPSISVTKRRSATTNSRCSSLATPRRASSSSDEREVDWSMLDKTEEREKEDRELPPGCEDESTAFLLARLEQENAALLSDSKAAIKKAVSRARRQSRPPSIGHLKKLVQDGGARGSVRYTRVPELQHLPEEPPMMTELEFWAALVQDYPSTASRLPTLTTTKIRSGIPPPLRGVVWTAMAGARDSGLEEAFEKLLGEKSPYEGIINKDVGRSFPGVELFMDAEGEGQRMLGRVLKCFSLHDRDIGYCQGLGFLVGPLLMNMGEREAFCVLVRLMDHYTLRPSFLPSLSGLHMRIFQFSALLRQHHPALSTHLTNLGVEPAYLSQWFLSCFAVTCPLPMLFRIYDVIFAEGANETVMRVALALMRRNEAKMMESGEFEEVMQLLLGRGIWDCYAVSPDELVDDFTSLGGVITHARMAELEKEFESQSGEAVGEKAGFLPDVQAAASRFLGRLWTPSHGGSKSTNTLSPQAAGETRPGGLLRRSASKQSISTLNESDSSTSSGSASLASTAPTEVEPDSTARESNADTMSMRSGKSSLRVASLAVPTTPGHDKAQQDLHCQIEELLIALSEMQREHALLAGMLQREREERSEDHRAVRLLVGKIGTEGRGVTVAEERRRTMPPPARGKEMERERPGSRGERRDELGVLVERVNERLDSNARFSASFETKAQLRSALTRTREQLSASEARATDLATRLSSSEASATTFQAESEDLRGEVVDLRQRLNEDFKERQRLEHSVRELQAQARSAERKERLARAESTADVPSLSRLDTSCGELKRTGSMASAPSASTLAGLRELKLGRRDSTSSIQSLRVMRSQRQHLEQQGQRAPSPSALASPSPPESATPLTPTPALGLPLPKEGVGFAPRGSSLATQAVLATPEHEIVPEEALLLELVNAKTAEAQARQEVDELKRSLAVQKRRQEQALATVQAQAEAARKEVEGLKAEAARAAESARAAQGVEPAEASVPTTPAAAEEQRTESPTITLETPFERAELKEAKTGPAGGGGWFWSRRTASTSSATTEAR